MIKAVRDTVWAFDLEWAPDPRAGRVLYRLPDGTDDAAAVAEMWKRNGATEADPFPFLKTVLCRVVSIAAVERRATKEGVKLNLLCLPRDPSDPAQNAESAMLAKFLDGIGRRHPQLVGYNSFQSDLKILLQRAIVNGITAPEFSRRPEKPWEGVDYFSRTNDWHVDLLDLLGGWGKSAMSLNELATLSGIPGKFETEGEQVAHLWLAGQWKAIVQYNCYDALTTYLVWLRAAHFSGHFNAAQYEEEQELVRQLIMDESEKEGGEYLGAYLDEWLRLEQATGQGG